jgi:hypothetical protein
MCQIYYKQHNLLNTAEWKQFKRIAGLSNKKLERMVHLAKLRSYRRDSFWKFGVLVPQTHAQAIKLDKKNNNTKWQDAEATEMGQLLEYQTFIDKEKGGNVPTRYQRIRCHMIYDVKHAGQHKACLVAGGHMTDPHILWCSFVAWYQTNCFLRRTQCLAAMGTGYW